MKGTAPNAAPNARQIERDRIAGGGAPLSVDEILQKLSDCRSQYPVTTGN